MPAPGQHSTQGLPGVTPRSRRPLEVVAMLLALCGIVLLAVATVAGLRHTLGGRGDEPVAAPARPLSAAPALAEPVRSAVQAHQTPVKARSRQARSQTKTAAATAAPRTRAPRSGTGSQEPRAPASPIRWAPRSAPSVPAPAAPDPRAAPKPRAKPKRTAPTPQAPPTPQAAPPPQAAPEPRPEPEPRDEPKQPKPEKQTKPHDESKPHHESKPRDEKSEEFDEHGTSPGSGTGSVPFDDSGGKPSHGR
jgi:hypothetical protein